MKSVISFATACLWLCACTSSSDKKSAQESETINVQTVNLSASFYKKLKGTIGSDMSITVELIRQKDSLNNQHSLTGSYYYNKIGMPLQLNGSMSDSATFELYEYNAKGETTGHFKGKFISENEAQGTWTNPKTKKEFPFQLNAEQTSLSFNFSEYYNENCDSRNRNMKSNKKDTLYWTDTMCNSIHVNLVTLAGNDKISQKINQDLLRTFLTTTGFEKPFKTVHDLLHSIDSLDFIMEAEYSTGIVTNENNILSMSVSGWQNSGGAHPNGFCFYVNYNTQTGDTISLLEIVKPETIDELVYRAKQQFIKENGNIKENGWFFDGDFVMPQTFSVGKGGLLFQYQSYEAGPYAMGAPQFFLSWKQLKDIVRPEYLK